MKSISFIIDSLDDEYKLTETLKKISQKHTKKNIYKTHIMVIFFCLNFNLIIN